MDAIKNFVKVAVSQGYDDTVTTIDLAAGEGAELPTPPFNLVWWDFTNYPDPADDPNVEIVRVTDVATDTLTIERGIGDTTASTKNTTNSEYKMILSFTKETFDEWNSGNVLSGSPISGAISPETHIVIGNGAETGNPSSSGNDEGAIAIGYNASSITDSTSSYQYPGIAIGKNTKAEEGDVLIGPNIEGQSGMVHGENVVVGGFADSSVDGFHNKNVIIGCRAQSGDASNVVIGYNAKATGTANNSVAIGYGAEAGKADCIAIGSSAEASYQINAIAIGSDSYTSRENGISLGYNTTNYGVSSIVIGANITIGVDNDYSVAIGTNAVVNNANEGVLGVASTETGTYNWKIPGNLIMENLPTTDPSVAGQFWNDAGTLKVSSGA